MRLKCEGLGFLTSNSFSQKESCCENILQNKKNEKSISSFPLPITTTSVCIHFQHQLFVSVSAHICAFPEFLLIVLSTILFLRQGKLFQTAVCKQMISGQTGIRIVEIPNYDQSLERSEQ